MVMVTGPLPTPVRTKESLTGPRSCAALFMVKVSAVSVQLQSTKAARNTWLARTIFDHHVWPGPHVRPAQFGVIDAEAAEIDRRVPKLLNPPSLLLVSTGIICRP